MILCVDPGIRAAGVSLFDSASKALWGAALIRNPITSGNDPAAVAALVTEIDVWARHTAPMTVKVVVVEVPRIYPAARQKGDQNDLIPVAGVSFAAASVLGRYGATLKRFYPRDWKGTVDADVCCRRVEAALTEPERGRIEKCPAHLRHNVLDAIGIGLKYLGRFEPVRVYPR
jgi:hypothetical protein